MLPDAAWSYLFRYVVSEWISADAGKVKAVKGFQELETDKVFSRPCLFLLEIYTLISQVAAPLKSKNIPYQWNILELSTGIWAAKEDVDQSTNANFSRL